jgi:hypothetical protein
MFVIPKPGVRVRRPVPPYAHVPVEGLEVPEESYWLRKVSDGDLLIGQPPVAHPTKSKETR